jgi:hypothetical protein
MSLPPVSPSAVHLASAPEDPQLGDLGVHCLDVGRAVVAPDTQDDEASADAPTSRPSTTTGR